MNNILKAVVKINVKANNFDWLKPFYPSEKYSSSGTGFFIDTNGTILTCCHTVIESVLTEICLYNDNIKYFAKILCICPEYDIAILKILKYKNKHYLKFSNKLDIGSPVKAVGYPLNSDTIKMTSGIISGIEVNKVQTDAAINPGNSGGPLLDKKNNVIGIIFQKNIEQTTDNVGYAIPIKLYTNNINQFKKHNIFHIPKFGFLWCKGSKELICKQNQGVYITFILTDSLINKAGIQKGCVLISLNKNKINYNGIINNISINTFLNNVPYGDNIIFEYIDLKNQIKKVTIKKITHNTNLILYKYPLFEEIKYTCFLGINVMELTLNHFDYPEFIKNKQIDLIKYLKSENRNKSVLIITNIFENCPIYNEDILSTGDIITIVNNTHISTIDEYNNTLLKSKTNITMELLNGCKVCINLKTYLVDEKNLINEYGYSPSMVFVKLLKNKISQKTRKQIINAIQNIKIKRIPK